MKPNELIGQLFLARDAAHITHLSTRSYAKHVALGAFYEGIIPLADSFAETYQGRYGLLGKIPLAGIKVSGDIVKFLEGQVKDIEANYKTLSNGCSALENVLDEILDLYFSAIYKLKFLA